MFKEKDMLIYKKDVCIIEKIFPKYLRGKDYYVLIPITDKSLKIQVPTDSNEIRNIISKEQVEKIIQTIPTIDVIHCDSKKLENEYKKLMQTGEHKDIIKIIKTAYLRNKERIENNKKTTDKDNYYFNQAEMYLYNEFSIALNLTYDETKQYIIDKINKLI